MGYQVALSVDGNHSVSVTAEDEAEITAGLVWAKRVHEQLRAMSRRQPPVLEHAPASASLPTDAEPPGPPPLCGLHQVAMVWQRGRRGYFWSCHERNPDGSWCTFKPITPPARDLSGA